MELKYIVTNEISMIKILKEKLSVSDRLYKKIKNKYIYVNGSMFDYNSVLHSGDIITIRLDYDEDNSNIVPNKNIKLNILYEDEWLLIVDKQANIPVHPSILHYENSLSNGIKYYYDKQNIQKKIRPINRLDKDTSGVVIFAKSEYIQDNIKINLKEYIAVVEGKLPNSSGTIDKPISRKEGSIIERCIDENGERAITHYEVFNTVKTKNIFDTKISNNIFESDDCENLPEYLSVVRCILETGKTHQIRVHLSSIGNPILGDDLYGKKSNLISRQALHCHHINFIHPITQKKCDIVSPIPKDMKFINISNWQISINHS